MKDPRRTQLHRWDIVAIAIMLISVIAVYWPAAPQPGAETQAAADFHQLHKHRMAFAREAIASTHALPAWYPRELLGAPFWSNAQNFPFLPQRLLLLALLDPESPYTFAIASCFSAALAALLTYLFCRHLRFGATASASAGFTFACCGYFAVRVTVGHLPLLEAYPSLPLLLLCFERFMQSLAARERRGRRAIMLGLACGVVMLAGHPQLTVYALIAASAYALYRFGSVRPALPVLGVMALGVGCAGFVLVPMSMLIGRSTRVLAGLAPPNNNIALPYRRMLGWWLPWIDGSVPPITGGDLQAFLRTYPTTAVFWDTVCYAGWTPWIAIVGLLLLSRLAPSRESLLEPRVRKFFVGLGVAGIVLALPAVHAITSLLPSTLLRSPSRLIYVTEFALAIALAAGVERVLRSTKTRPSRRVALAAVLVLHALDLGMFDRHFIFRTPARVGPTAAESAAFASRVGDGRVAIDLDVDIPLNRRLDDLGFFDSIILARPYRAMMNLGDVPPGTNEQQVNGRRFGIRALNAADVRFIVTMHDASAETDPKLHLGSYKVWDVPGEPAGRAQFYVADRTTYLTDDELHKQLRDPDFNPATSLLLPASAQSNAPTGRPTSLDDPRVTYRRPGTDRIECDITTGRAGYLRVTESFDPGWSATVDGARAPIVPALDCMLAVGLTPGRHTVVFEYRTPGVMTGVIVSIVCLASLIGVSIGLSRRIS